MTTSLRIIKNSAAMALSSGLDRFVDFFLIIFIARILGKEAFGEYALVLSIMAIFQVVAVYGLDEIVIRDVARSPDKIGKYLVNVSLLGLLTSGLAALAMMVAVNILDYDPSIVQAAYVAAIALIFSMLARVSQAMIQAVERMEFVTVIRFISNVTKVGLSLVLLWLGYGVIVVFLALAISQLLMYLLYVAIIIRLYGWPHLKIDWDFNRGIMRTGGVFLVIAIFAVINKRGGPIFISKLASVEAVGAYSAANRVLGFGQMMVPALLFAMSPILAAFFLTSRSKFSRMAEYSMRILLMATLPVAIMVTFLAQDIIELIYGPDYDESVILLQILIWRLVIFSVNATLFRSIIASNNERVTMRVAGVNLIATVVLSLLLIPIYGAVGAAIATIGSITCGVLQNYLFVSRNLFKVNLFQTFAKPLFAAALMVLLALALTGINVYLAVIAGLGFYVLALFATGSISSDEIALMQDLWAEVKTRFATGNKPAATE